MKRSLGLPVYKIPISFNVPREITYGPHKDHHVSPNPQVGNVGRHRHNMESWADIADEPNDESEEEEGQFVSGVNTTDNVPMHSVGDVLRMSESENSLSENDLNNGSQKSRTELEADVIRSPLGAFGGGIEIVYPDVNAIDVALLGLGGTFMEVAKKPQLGLRVGGRNMGTF
ncbi:hypothetical protein NE237_027442 [Protea cynaroides]|uniref:Uncharacterized protein n=1 Tax=Protea cynaroides TaxID=273540 RepID=A0A9Q0GNE3_9MAGN|nr:hypothetical protein NE237_027442 [Protea cynaroides]